MDIDILARTTKNGDYYLKLSVTKADENEMTSVKIDNADGNIITMPVKYPKFGYIKAVKLKSNDSNIEDISIDKPISLWLSSSENFTPLDTNPDEAKDILLVLHYKLGNE